MGCFGAARVLILVAAVLPHSAAVPARIKGRQLIVDGEPVHLKGVCWNPVPKGGVHPKDLDFRGFVTSDAELMAQAGINAVRTYEAINDTTVLDVLWKKRIYVLNTVYIWGKDPLSMITERVNAVKHHPAILMWVVGNEWNYNGLYVGLPFPEALNRVKEAVQLIKSLDSTHPVATVHGEIPSNETLQTLRDVDAWGINKYSGLDFGDLFENWKRISSAPMFLGEYGADDYDSRTSRRDQEDQAKATTVLTQQIVKASSVNPGGVCIGGIIFEFADEWWKDGSGNPNKHDVGGVSPGGGPFPDFTFNEEWWGLVGADGRPRKSFWAYADVEIPGATSLAALPARTDGTDEDGHLMRKKVCGAHVGCRGSLGYCCPRNDGSYASCCTATTTPPPTKAPKVMTTWRPPVEAPSLPVLPGASTCGHGTYREQPGKFANGHFQVGTIGCHGVGECQFRTRRHAQEFCDVQPKCTAVLLHPFEDDCAGGFGCYTPRFGEIAENTLWDRSGGRAWAKGPCDESTVDQGGPTDGGASDYAFIGFFSAIEAQSACRKYGRLAMPKTAGQRRALQDALDAAQAAGKFSDAWPKNTIWLGGQYNPTKKRWQWNDGTPMTEFNWAAGQPSAAKTNQMTEPWLCMVLSGEMHDSDPPYHFGVMCELHKEVKQEVPAEVAKQSLVPVPAPGPRRQLPHRRPRPPPSTTAAPVHRRLGRFEFAGFANPAAARSACSSGMRPVMPKTQRDLSDLMKALDTAVEAGSLSKRWPQNTIWLGGHWSTSNKRWEWDDGSPVGKLNWALGQPSADEGRQDQEPWLCMVLSGEVHDSDPPFSFGVICEETGREEAGPPPPLPPVSSKAPASADGEDRGDQAQENSKLWKVTLSRATYTFAGFGGPVEARDLCRGHGHLASVKTAEEREELLQAVRRALVDGAMSRSWPKNTLWLGGRWRGKHGRWEWDDGEAINELHWAQGQPSSADRQTSEPWLCMVPDGDVHDSDPPYTFGAMCQQDAIEGGRHMLDDGSVVHRVTWIRGPAGANCHEACAAHGFACNREAWPSSASVFNGVVLPQVGVRCTVEEGGYSYDPSSSPLPGNTSWEQCSWRGPKEDTAWAWRRCEAPAPYKARRFCPCGGAGTGGAAPVDATPIYS